MIKEIQFPLPTVKQRQPRVEDGRHKEAKNKIINKYDYIRFDRDTSFVRELAEACNIPEELALDLLIVFFDELKRNMLLGNIITLSRFGKFYAGGGNYDKKRNNHTTNSINVIGPIVPRFKAARSLKQLLAVIYG